MWFRRRPFSITTARTELRLPVMRDHAAWVRERRASEDFLRPWEPAWGSRPVFQEGLRKPGLPCAEVVRRLFRACPLHLPQIRQVAGRFPDLQEHPQGVCAVRHARLLGRKAPRATGVHVGSASGRRRPCVQRTGSQPPRSGLPARKRCVARAARKGRFPRRGIRGSLPADRRLAGERMSFTPSSGRIAGTGAWRLRSNGVHQGARCRSRLNSLLRCPRAAGGGSSRLATGNSPTVRPFGAIECVRLAHLHLFSSPDCVHCAK